jgi:hypothetical protein
VWDCCAGSGNLLAGLTNKYNIWASTLDKSDVDIMKQRIENGANLLEDHVFQFDFLNDDFTKLPKRLQEIIIDETECKKLIIYINPPYAEAGIYGTKDKAGVSNSKIKNKYKSIIGYASTELYVQFFIRICKEIKGCYLASFSTLKYVSAPILTNFRREFNAKFLKGFVVSANTFDNVKGSFPISFNIWNLSYNRTFKSIECDIYEKTTETTSVFKGKKQFHSYNNEKFINDWLKLYDKKTKDNIGYLFHNINDFQTQNGIFITLKKPKGHYTQRTITVNNLIECCVYFAVRKVIAATWLNDRDQFLMPNKKWNKDVVFKNDCFAYAVFNTIISTKDGVNHWIPFVEDEIGLKSSFESHVMTNFITGERVQNGYTSLFDAIDRKTYKKLEFSKEAQAVFAAGKEIWKHYHWQDKKMFEFRFGKQKYNVNASYYDIRAYFKGFETDKKGKERMNNKSADEKFNELEKNLSQALNILAQKIEPKVYEYEFLMK